MKIIFLHLLHPAAAAAAAAAAALREVQQQPGGGGEWWTTTRGSPIIISVPALNGGFSSVSLCAPLIPPSLPPPSLIVLPMESDRFHLHYLSPLCALSFWDAPHSCSSSSSSSSSSKFYTSAQMRLSVLLWTHGGFRWTGCRPVTARQSRDGPPGRISIKDK